MDILEQLKATQMWTEVGKARGYSGASAKRRHIDTLRIGETFTLAGFSFRVEDFVPSERPKKRRTSYYDPTAEPPERPRNYPDLAYVIGLSRGKAKKGEKGGSDRGENRDRRLVQAELL